ncbi:zinc-dependent alcohol dehydrogenase [Oceanobacillus neutriphilus]|uniref:Sorbitol dehydrogenase n=1 Tax=Oceanobacillus neutriphilus TaxID=531815 RepID=A0ABQ2NSP6_9BACI|nr:alcohol dehydrogenase catalytic domain-containing protein [Oceanobacillus neutriphilus]GGP10081.1 sorbitol dehydrogenase [Oceanobacillus neutriphilus]
MKAVFVDDAEKVVVKEAALPELKEDEVQIKVSVAGICGSDIHTYKGLHPFRKPPVIIGHEVAGEVVEVGEKVTHFKVGDRVTVEPQIGTGESEGIMTGNVNYSDNRLAPGMGDWLGTMAEYFIAPETQVLALPDTVTYDEGVLVEPLAVGVHAAYKGEVQPTDRVAILGAGPIGLLTLIAVKDRGAENIVVTDVLEYSLDKAKEMGASSVINIKDNQNWVNEAKQTLDKGSFDKVFITAGVPGIVNDALNLLKKGGRVVTVAMFHGQQEIDIEQLQQNEKEVAGCMTYNRPDSEKALEIITKGELNVTKVISHKLHYEQAGEGFKMVDKKLDNSVKVLISFE